MGRRGLLWVVSVLSWVVAGWCALMVFGGCRYWSLCVTAICFARHGLLRVVVGWRFVVFAANGRWLLLLAYVLWPWLLDVACG